MWIKSNRERPCSYNVASDDAHFSIPADITLLPMAIRRHQTSDKTYSGHLWPSGGRRTGHRDLDWAERISLVIVPRLGEEYRTQPKGFSYCFLLQEKIIVTYLIWLINWWFVLSLILINTNKLSCQAHSFNQFSQSVDANLNAIKLGIMVNVPLISRYDLLVAIDVWFHTFIIV